MKDLEIILENKVGTLAHLAGTLGENGISLEGGGVFQNGKNAIAHFLVEEAEKAKKILKQAGIRSIRINKVLTLKLQQDIPGQLGMFCRKLAEANINILVQYSDHANQLILVVDDYEKAKEISRRWMNERN